MIHRHTENMEMTRERISFTVDPRDTLLSLQMGFSFVRAAVACSIFERISGLDGWLVGCFGFNGPLRQYFSLYRAVSQREGEREEKG